MKEKTRFAIVLFLMVFFATAAITPIIKGLFNYQKNSMNLETNSKYDKKLDGLHIKNATYEKAREITKKRDPKGDWVCTNVRNMEYGRCVEVARHECAHEIWAEICEKDSELCDKGQELLNNYSRQNE